MVIESIHIDASCSDVFAVLADGWRFSNWVVGTSHMYAVQSEWPAPGSKLWHASGAWPFVVRDETEVIAAEPERRMELVARGGPLGQATIVLELAEDGAGCRVTMGEQPSGGPGRLLNNPAGAALLRRRNIESLTRLKALAERRTAPMR